MTVSIQSYSSNRETSAESTNLSSAGCTAPVTFKVYINCIFFGSDKKETNYTK